MTSPLFGSPQQCHDHHQSCVTATVSAALVIVAAIVTAVALSEVRSHASSPGKASS